MNDEELVNECLRKYGTNEAALNSIRCYGADESVLQALREFGAGEELDNASNALRDYRHRKYAVDCAMEKARCRKAELDSIAESPVWKDPQFLNHLAAIAQEKSRETTKHYINGAGQPATGPKSRMGNPRRGADGRVIWDTSADSGGISAGQFDPASAHLRKAQQGSLQNCGQCAHYNQDKTCQIVTGPVSADLTCDKFTAIPAKPVSLVYGAASRDSVQRKNVTADGKLDPNKSLMGNPRRNPDGSITWT